MLSMVWQTWAAASSGTFSDPANWENNEVPDASDVVVLEGNGGENVIEISQQQ